MDNNSKMVLIMNTGTVEKHINMIKNMLWKIINKLLNIVVIFNKKWNK